MKKTVTIGIPAYNEEMNIGHLLNELKNQSSDSYILEKILIISDGSTDKTVAVAKRFPNPILSVINGEKRLGVAARQNEIIQSTKSDILIILNSDISIKDPYFIEHIIQPIIEKRADLVTPEFKQLLPATFFERILYRSCEFKSALYEDFHNGKNVYTCCGPARAFSKRLYSKLHFKDSSYEDAYSFIYTVINGYTYLHIHDTAVYFRLPSNFSDHRKQSTRFFHSKASLIKEFGRENIDKNYTIPLPTLLNSMKKYFLRYPLEISIYGGILSYTWLLSKIFPTNITSIWESSKSSKVLKS